MGTTAQKLQYLVNAKAAIDTALTNKGVTPPTALADYGTAIGMLGYKNKLQQIIDRTVTEITAEDLAGCTSIGRYSFYGCNYLQHITLPGTITSIGDYAFGYCTALISITIFAITPPTLSYTHSFEGTNNCPIYVPAASVDTYKGATNWSSLADRIFAIQE